MTIAIGDVHGNAEALDDLLRALRPQLTATDVVVFLGDYIDRGPDTRQCIDLILAFEAERRAEVVGLPGNHDDWLLRTRRDFRNHTWLLATDPFVTIRSYSPQAADALLAAKAESRGAVYGHNYPLPYDLFFDAMPASHLDWFERLRVSHHTADCFCSHGGRDTVVSGQHNNAVLSPDGWPIPAITERTIGIDTISRGDLTTVRMPGAEIVQSARRRNQVPSRRAD